MPRLASLFDRLLHVGDLSVARVRTLAAFGLTIAAVGSVAHAQFAFTNRVPSSTWTDVTQFPYYVNQVYVSNGTIYLATDGGVCISNNGGELWTCTGPDQGLGNDQVNAVYERDGTVYAATAGGLSISTDGGSSWTTHTSDAPDASNSFSAVYASGGVIYAAVVNGSGGTLGGVYISTDGGETM